MSYSVHFSFFTLISVSRDIPGPRVSISHFSNISVFLAMFQVLQCVYLIFHDFQCFSPHSRSYQLIFSISELVNFLDIFQVLHCAFLIFHGFHWFLQYSRSYSVCVSYFPRFFQFSRHNPGPTIWVCHFSCWSVLSPYSRSYSVHFSFLPFSVFLAIFQVLQCVYV